jgi:hypothetical protein
VRKIELTTRDEEIINTIDQTLKTFVHRGIKRYLHRNIKIPKAHNGFSSVEVNGKAVRGDNKIITFKITIAIKKFEEDRPDDCNYKMGPVSVFLDDIRFM